MARVSRRAALGKAAALTPLIAAPAFAEPAPGCTTASADEALNAARVIERAKAGGLVDGSSATCAELDALIGTLSHATLLLYNTLGLPHSILLSLATEVFVLFFLYGGRSRGHRFEKDKVDARYGDDKEAARDREKLQAQVDKLKKIRKEKDCPTAGANLRQLGLRGLQTCGRGQTGARD